MQFKADSETLANLLTHAAQVAGRDSAMPILGNVLMRTKGDCLTVAATDLGISIYAEIPVKVGTEGAVILPAKRLSAVVKALPGNEVGFSTGDNLHVTVGSGKSTFIVPGQTDRDFPTLLDPSEVKCIRVPSKMLVSIIDKTIFAVSTDETRHHMNGVAFKVEGGKARAKATDGHRLASIEVETKVEGDIPEVIIPRKALAEMRRLLAGVDDLVGIGATDKHFVLRDDSITFVANTIATTLPSIETVIEATTAHDKLVEVDRASLIDALKRVLLASSEGNVVKVNLAEDQLHLHSEQPNGSGSEELTVAYKGAGIKTAFNAKHVIDAIAAIDTPKVKLVFGNEVDPVKLLPVVEEKHGLINDAAPEHHEVYVVQTMIA
jgi:DNA polymerase-3 subunit beta